MSSPHRGGRLEDMAPSGTTIPNDAGLQNTIPSVPRPDQRAEHGGFDNYGVAQPSAAFAADNATDMPRSARDMGATGEVLTGTGNSFPAEGESKRTFIGNQHPGAKGHGRDLKHRNLNRSGFERFAAEEDDAAGEHQIRNE
ncbi:hypothetical protein BO82DRAFT_432960 [Aspergillus uvarum CBS 121591]|uniref:Uncharacterized protein n=4 Tax=Aspergillus TaxID=5052 RepID=A0A319CB56_9EURO|nr:hypothetical protein BO82DRAFT_432960 [Aspergillus uvarum CBS 121591]XP_025531494.1 hypothetical protein BO86DRAFT_453440 [Aspergillus japonicus CBS 114.51]PYI15411.1 hypothetical protein BO99DRAFT_405929 [Aspergillus violaceofuscus CBS 115571]PYI26673.1 hypothetical protein BP00DRAFT_430135 [Aspergillus indologenus CBS 114.80]PYH80817.1 hypothetical protein BO82DRAFT_432960 [Aspergillus uvarum CBS 121591]RAH85600.1 hypothetical protein BO86DRAFT_453440 [Aspergillus japonicus CBS 114.51]